MGGWDEVKFLGLGFDPLPGDPAVALDLASDAKVVGNRLKDQAAFLRRAANPEGWTGEAADAFVAHLGRLPDEMDRMGDAFLRLVDPLTEYHDRFAQAQRQAQELDTKALEARTAFQNLLDAANGPSLPRVDPTPSFQAADPGPSMWPAGPATSTTELTAAGETLTTILQKARRLGEDFERTLSDLESEIRALSEWAPDRPQRSGLSGLIRSLADHTGVTAAVDAIRRVDDLFIHSARYLSNLSDLLQTASAILGTASLLMVWAPGIGGTLGAISLAAAGGAAALKTTLFLTGAKDEYGRAYVSRKELTGSLIVVSAGAAGAGIGAATARAGHVAKATAAATKAADKAEEAAAAVKAAKEAAPSFASKFTEGLKPKALAEGWKTEVQAQRAGLDLFREVGGREFAKRAAGDIGANLRAMSATETVFTVSGRVFDLVNPVATPIATGEHPDPRDLGGFRSGIKAVRQLPEDFMRSVQNEARPFGAHLNDPSGAGQFMVGDAPKPVMGS